MSELSRCIVRNAIIGALASFACYMVYGPMLLGHATPFSIAMLGTSCALSFAGGASLWSNNQDHFLFRYYQENMRIAMLFTAPCTFLGLFFFHWWGLGAGFIGAMLMTYTCISLYGKEKPSQATTEALTPGPLPRHSYHAVSHSSSNAAHAQSMSTPSATQVTSLGNSSSVIFSATSPVRSPVTPATPSHTI
jgi:hypothetical protein